MRRSSPLALLLLALMALPQAAPAQQDSPERAIIDVHLHALPLEFFPPHHDEIVGFDRPETDGDVMQRTLEALERFGIERALTSGTPGLIARYLEADRGRIVPSLMVPPMITREELASLVDSLPRWHEEGRFQVIGEVATQYAGIPPSDPALEPLFAFAEREGVPVGIHMGPGPPGAVYEFAPEFRMRYGDPLELEEVLARHPDLKIYVMHAGYPRLGEMIALLDQYPQVHADLSVINWVYPREAFHRYLLSLVEAGHASRLMYGSDQMIWPDAIAKGIEAIESADFLSEEQKRAIFYDNAVRFLNLESDGR